MQAERNKPAEEPDDDYRRNGAPNMRHAPFPIRERNGNGIRQSKNESRNGQSKQAPAQGPKHAVGPGAMSHQGKPNRSDERQHPRNDHGQILASGLMVVNSGPIRLKLLTGPLQALCGPFPNEPDSNQRSVQGYFNR